MVSHKRSWWQVPSKATEVDEHRVVSTIELFCDLVFVAYVAIITHNLSEHMNIQGIQTFIVYFSIGWVIWFNSALYHDLHSNNDFKTRVMTFIQMILIGLMAVFTKHHLVDGYVGFAISLSSIITLLGTLWRETGIVDPSHQVYSKPYSRMFYIAASFAIVSTRLNPSHRLFYLTIIVALITIPLLTNYIFVSKKLKKEFVARMKLSNAFIERSNLYFIIMLGEIIIGSLNGVVEYGMNSKTIVFFIFSFLVAFGLWFTHFEFVGYIQHQETVCGYFMWLFSFYLETMMVAAIGSGIYLSYRYLSIEYLVVPTAIFFVATLIHFTFNDNVSNPNMNLNISYTKGYIMCSILLLVMTYSIEVLTVKMMFYLVALYIPVIFGLRQWMKNSGG